MSGDTTTAGPPPERLHWIQVKLAFGKEGREPARPATLVAVEGAEVRVRYRDGSEDILEVVEPDRLGDLLDSAELCRLDGEVLVLVNTYYRVLGVATGPSEAPEQLRTSLAFAFENNTVKRVMSAAGDQPTIHTFALRSKRW
ncbi:MAG: hypothetical protein ACK5O2_16265 [Microthrixaceae bacterium]